jgi:hypothetical protein
VLVIKTLPLPILIQSLTVLLNPPEWGIKEIHLYKTFFIIFCGIGRMIKIKCTIMINGWLKNSAY